MHVPVRLMVTIMHMNNRIVDLYTPHPSTFHTLIHVSPTIGEVRTGYERMSEMKEGRLLW